MMQFTVGEPVELAWAAWTAEEVAAGQFSRVEIEIDGLGMNGVPAPLPLPATGEFVYTIPPSLLTIGTHTAQIRVCRADVCGDWSVIDIEIIPVAPGVVRGFTVRSKSPVISADDGVAMIHAYTTLATSGKTRKLNDAGVQYLAMKAQEELVFPVHGSEALGFIDRHFTKAIS
jgi:hypothetical protein